MKTIRAPKIPERLEADEAEVWLWNERNFVHFLCVFVICNDVNFYRLFWISNDVIIIKKIQKISWIKYSSWFFAINSKSSGVDDWHLHQLKYQNINKLFKIIKRWIFLINLDGLVVSHDIRKEFKYFTNQMVSSVRENRWRIWQMYEIFIFILILLINIAWDDWIFNVVLALPFREERLRVNAKMLDIYLTPLQMRRFKVFTRLLDGDAQQLDVYTLIVSAHDSNRHFVGCQMKTNLFFQRYLYGFPIGLAVGVPESEITRILETQISMDEIARQLGILATTLCKRQFPDYSGNTEHIVREIVRNLLTKSFWVQVQVHGIANC